MVLDLGVDVIFTVVASGPGLMYQWYRDGDVLTDGLGISGTNTSSLTITSVQAGDAGSYHCVVSNAFGSVTSTAAALISDNGKCHIIKAPPDFLSFCSTVICSYNHIIKFYIIQLHLDSVDLQVRTMMSVIPLVHLNERCVWVSTNIGSCVEAGFTDCCDDSECGVGECFCDITCYEFEDCCDDFEEICDRPGERFS